MSAPDGAVAVVVARDGRLPMWADDAVAEAEGRAVVVGSGTEEAAVGLRSARQVCCAETGPAFRPAALAAALAPHLADAPLVVLPASPDGRDLAPRLAAALDRPLLARVVRAEQDGPGVRAVATRIDDRVMVPVEASGPAVVTLVGGGRGHDHGTAPATCERTALDLAADPSADGGGGVTPLGGSPTADPELADPELVALLAPDLRTMDLADAVRVVAGGAGLVTGLDDAHATAAFTLLTGVAAALGGSAGATRVATDAGWTDYDRQIGTTGVTVDPDLYIALGISGAAQHTGGLGAPRHVVSVNIDPSCPMTALADLGLVADAGALLAELARRLGVAVPEALDHAHRTATGAKATTGGDHV